MHAYLVAQADTRGAQQRNLALVALAAGQQTALLRPRNYWIKKSRPLCKQRLNI